MSFRVTLESGEAFSAGNESLLAAALNYFHHALR